jgi:hypothetical protein
MAGVDGGAADGRGGAATELAIMSVVIDCADPYRLARFWSAALGYRPERGEEDWADLGAEGEAGELEWVRLVDPRGAGGAVAFQRVPEAKSVKNRVHLDLAAADEEAEVRRLESLGARRLWHSEDPDDVFIVLGDPEGNEFCVVRR